jgi:WD40 repeat protein
MSKGGEHNLYELAFGLPEGTSDPDPYTLLKLAPFTDARDAIENAVLQRWSDLQLLQGFGDGSEVTQLETEVNAARDLLLDDSRRAELDQRLREQGVVAPDPVTDTADDTPQESQDPTRDAAQASADGSEDAASQETGSEESSDAEEDVSHAEIEQDNPKTQPLSETSDEEIRPDTTQDQAEVDSLPVLHEPAAQPARFPIRKLFKLVVVISLVVVGIKLLPEQLLERIDFESLFPTTEKTPDTKTATNSTTTNGTSTNTIDPISENKGDTTEGNTTPTADSVSKWKPIRVASSDARIKALSSSLDGSLFAIATDDRRVQIVSTVDPNDVRFASEPLPFDDFNDLAFSEDGSSLLASSFDAVRVWRNDGTQWKLTVEESLQDTSCSLLSPDGQNLAIVPEPNNEFVVYGFKDNGLEEIARKKANFVRAAFIDGSRLVSAGDFGVASASNGNYPAIGGLKHALVQISETQTGEFTELINIPGLAKKASKIRFVAANTSGTETAIALLSSVDSETQQLLVWVFDQEFQKKSPTNQTSPNTLCMRYEVEIKSLTSLSGLRVSVNASKQKACVVTETGVVVFDWQSDKTWEQSLDAKIGKRIVDVNLSTNRITAIDATKENTCQWVLIGELEPKSTSPVRVSRVIDVGNSKNSGAENDQTLSASFWKASPSAASPWVLEAPTTPVIFSQPRCRVLFAQDDLLIVRDVSSDGMDQLIGFNTAADPPTKQFVTEVPTKDLIAISPDRNFILRLADGLTTTEISAYQIDSKKWSKAVQWKTTRDRHLAFSVTNWPDQKSWNRLIQLKLPKPVANDGLRFSRSESDTETPYVYFGIVGQRWFGTVGIDVRALFAGLPIAIGSIDNAWPVTFNERDTSIVDSQIQRAEFVQNGTVAICQYVSDSQSDADKDRAASTLKRLNFGKGSVAGGFAAVGSIAYHDMWGATADGNQAIVTNKGGLILCAPGQDQSIARGNIRFNRGDDRGGSLLFSSTGSSFLLIDPTGMANLYSWYRSKDAGRAMVRLSQERLLDPSRSDSWIRLAGQNERQEGSWMRLTPVASNVRIRNRRLSTAISPSGNRVAVGTPEGVLLWRIPPSFVEQGNLLAAQQQAISPSVATPGAIRTTTLKPIVDLVFSGRHLVASVQDADNQLEFYKKNLGRYKREATATIPGSQAQLVNWSTRSSRPGLAIGTSQGELFLMPETESQISGSGESKKASPLDTNSSIRVNVDEEHPAAIRALSTMTGFGLFAYSTPKGFFLVDAKRTQDQIHKFSVSDPDKPAFVAFSRKVGERRTTNDSLMADLRYTRIGGDKRGYKLYLNAVTRRAGKWQVTHVANVELENRIPIGNPIVLEINSTEALAIVPTGMGAFLYLLDGKKLKAVGTLPATGLTTISVSNFGDQIAIGTNRGEVHVWGSSTFDFANRAPSVVEIFKVLTGSEIETATVHRSRITIQVHSNPVTAIAFDPNGKSLVSGSSVGELREWSVN